MFKLNSGGSPFYTDIVGAEKFAETKTGGIPGIKTDDKTGEIVINLTKPRGTFTNELGLLFVAPVPPNTPDKDQSANPPPATGPYVITKSEPGPRLVLRAQPAVGEDQREADARPAQRPRRQDRHHGGPQPVDPGQRRRAGQDRLDVQTRRPPTATRK